VIVCSRKGYLCRRNRVSSRVQLRLQFRRSSEIYIITETLMKWQSINDDNNTRARGVLVVAIRVVIRTATARVHSVHAMNTETAPGGRRPLDQANRLEPQARLYRQPVNLSHHRHLLLLLSPKADTRFTVPRRVEGWVDLGGCYMLRWFARP